MDKVDEIAARLKRATKGRWHWWTSNSWRRLMTENQDYTTGPVLIPAVSRADGHPDCSIRESDMALIENAPGDLGYLLKLVEVHEKMLRGHGFTDLDITHARMLAAGEEIKIPC
jgi:hypothetical protein